MNLNTVGAKKSNVITLHCKLISFWCISTVKVNQGEKEWRWHGIDWPTLRHWKQEWYCRCKIKIFYTIINGTVQWIWDAIRYWRRGNESVNFIVVQKMTFGTLLLVRLVHIRLHQRRPLKMKIHRLVQIKKKVLIKRRQTEANWVRCRFQLLTV